MARGSWIYDPVTDRMVPKGEFLRAKAARLDHSRSSLSKPMVIGTMEPIRSMADGRIYDDKSSYYKSVARAGCEIVGFEKNFGETVQRRADEIAVSEDKRIHADIVQDIKHAIEIETAK